MTVEAPLPPRPADIGATLDRADLDDVVRERRVDESELDGGELAGLSLHNLRLRESRLLGVDLSGTAMAGLDLADVVVRDGSWANVNAGQATIVRLEANGLRVAPEPSSPRRHSPTAPSQTADSTSPRSASRGSNGSSFGIADSTKRTSTARRFAPCASRGACCRERAWTPQASTAVKSETVS